MLVIPVNMFHICLLSRDLIKISERRPWRRKKNPRRFDFIEFSCLVCEFISPRFSSSSAQLARFMKDYKTRINVTHISWVIIWEL